MIDHRAALCAVLLIATIVRGAVLVAMFGQLRADPDAYRQIAENLLQHGSLALDMASADDSEQTEREGYKPTAFRPPLYPLLLAAANLGSEQVSPLRVALLHWLLGVATVGVTWLVGRRLKLERGAVVAALLVACDPILLNQSTLVMTETLAAFLAVLALYAWLRMCDQPSLGAAAMVGIVIGIAGLCRPTFLPWLALLLVALLAARDDEQKRAGFGGRLRLAAAIGVCALLALSPWIVRNQRVFGRPIVTTTHGGYTLLLGNNPAYYRYLESGDHTFPWPADDPAFQALLPHPAPPAADELKYDAATKQLAIDSIQAQPTSFLWASIDRVLQLWNPLPHRTPQSKSRARDLLRYATCAWYLLVYGFALVGIVTLRGRLPRLEWLAGLLLCLSFTLMHSVYWSNLRMRAPLMPVVALLAGAGAVSLAGRQELLAASTANRP